MRYLALTGGAVCAAGVAIAVPLLVAHAAPAPAVSAALPPGVSQRLTAIAERADRANGGKPVLWASVVRTTRSKALTSATPGDYVPGGGSAAVYLITMRGTFTANDGPGPAGASAPAGHYLSLVVNATTFESMDFGLAPGPPPVSPASLGPVTYLNL